MKIYFYISVAAAALSLVLSIVLFAVGSSNQSLQNEVQKKQVELQKQQEEINKGTTIQQKIGPSLLNDMAVVSANDEKMRALLSKHGYTVKANSPAPGASPAPAAPAKAPAPAPAQ
jgi:hypothetical protein